MVGHGWREAPHDQPAHCLATTAVTQFGGTLAKSGAQRQPVCEEGNNKRLEGRILSRRFLFAYV